jgi:hypothetical protein
LDKQGYADIHASLEPILRASRARYMLEDAKQQLSASESLLQESETDMDAAMGRLKQLRSWKKPD